MSKFLVDGKNTVSVLNVNDFKGHRGSAVNGILGAAGRAETAVTTKWYKFKRATGRTAIHGTAKGRVTTVNHTVNVFDDGLTWM